MTKVWIALSVNKDGYNGYIYIVEKVFTTRAAAMEWSEENEDQYDAGIDIQESTLDA